MLCFLIDVSLGEWEKIPRLFRRRKDRHVREGIQVTDSVRHTVGKRYPGEGVGMDPGFHRGDGIGESLLQVDGFRILWNNTALMSYRWKTVSRSRSREKVDFKSTGLKSLGTTKLSRHTVGKRYPG